MEQFPITKGWSLQAFPAPNTTPGQKYYVLMDNYSLNYKSGVVFLAPGFASDKKEEKDGEVLIVMRNAAMEKDLLLTRTVANESSSVRLEKPVVFWLVTRFCQPGVNSLF